jgi:hypothetical protein
MKKFIIDGKEIMQQEKSDTDIDKLPAQTFSKDMLTKHKKWEVVKELEKEKK